MYLWTISYSFIVLYTEKKSTKNEKFNKIANNFLHISTVNMKNIYFDWHKNLPSPEIFQYLNLNDNNKIFNSLFENFLIHKNNEEYKYFEYIKLTNIIYESSIKFILYHELAHYKHGHIYKDWASQKYNKIRSIETIKKEEIEADNFAIDLILMDNMETTQTKQKTGIIVGVFSNLFLSGNLKVATHPDNDDRLKNIFAKINIENNKFLKDFTNFLFSLWFENYHKEYSQQNSIIENMKTTDFLKELEKIKNT